MPQADKKAGKVAIFPNTHTHTHMSVWWCLFHMGAFIRVRFQLKIPPRPSPSRSIILFLSLFRLFCYYHGCSLIFLTFLPPPLPSLPLNPHTRFSFLPTHFAFYQLIFALPAQLSPLPNANKM